MSILEVEVDNGLMPLMSRFRLWVFYFLVFFLPWQTRWIIRDTYIRGGVWEYGRVSLYGWDVLLILLVLVSWPATAEVIKTWPRLPRGQRLRATVFSNPLVLYCAFLAYAFFSTLWAPDSVLVLYWGLRLGEVGLLWLLIRVLKPKLAGIWLSLCAAGTVQALWAVWQFLNQSTFASKWLGVATHSLSSPGTSVVLTSTGRWLRAYGGQVHPNVLGGLLVVTCLATVWLYLRVRERNLRVARLLTLIAIAVQAAGLFFSFSRGAWVALVAGLVLWWLLHNASRRALLLPTLAALGTLVVLGAVCWQPTAGRLFGGSRLEQQSLDDRVGEAGESKALLRTHWFAGVGLGNYTRALYDAEPNRPSYLYQPVHNLFVLVLTELGVVGLGLLLWLLWVYLSSPTLRYDLIFLTPVLTVALLDHYWWTSGSMLLLGSLVLSLPEQSTATP